MFCNISMPLYVLFCLIYYPFIEIRRNFILLLLTIIIPFFSSLIRTLLILPEIPLYNPEQPLREELTMTKNRRFLNNSAAPQDQAIPNPDAQPRKPMSFSGTKKVAKDEHGNVIFPLENSYYVEDDDGLTRVEEENYVKNALGNYVPTKEAIKSDQRTSWTGLALTDETTQECAMCRDFYGIRRLICMQDGLSDGVAIADGEYLCMDCFKRNKTRRFWKFLSLGLSPHFIYKYGGER